MKEFLIFFLIGLSLVTIQSLFQTKPNRFEGRVIGVSSWDGKAQLSTKINNKDTIIIVRPERHERFVVGQLITVWAGGNNMGYEATTEPQEN